MHRLKIKDLQRLALHCGYRTESAKAARLQAIEHSAGFYNGILGQLKPQLPINILSIDVGLKNFSYSKVSYSAQIADIKEWNVIDLHSEYGTQGYADEGSLVDSKAYLAKLALSVVDNVLISSPWVPSVITIENQRTRSASSKATLPNVLLNYTLEHMLYAAFAARQASNSDYQSTVVVPMNANKMVSYWVSRYTESQRVPSGSRSKTFRKTILYGWLKDPQYAPFDMSAFTNRLPAEFAGMGTKQSNAALRSVLEIKRENSKIDDLVDSLLYSISIARQMFHHKEIIEYIERSDTDKILQLLNKWDAEHVHFLQPLLSLRDDVSLAEEYASIS